MYRVLPLVVTVLALVAWFGTPALADDKADAHEGIVVSAGGGKLTMTDTDGSNEHSHRVAANAVITCDGKKCKLTDLKKGYPVKVTLGKQGGQEVAIKIEAKSKS